MITKNSHFSPLFAFEQYLQYQFSLSKCNKRYMSKINNFLQNKNRKFYGSADKKFIHSSSIRWSHSTENININTILTNSIEVERLSNLQLVKYNTDVNKEDLNDLGLTSSIGESLPWLLDDEGKNIDFNKPISLFNGVRLISNYLEKRFNMDKNLISEVRITELLKLFEENKKATVLDLYNHVADLYKNDKESFKITADILSSDSSNLDKSFKPLGEYGDITLNEAFLSLKDLKWEIILNNTPPAATIHAVPFAVNFIGFSLMMRSYMKFVHNRPFEPDITTIEKQIQQKARNRNLALFVFFWAPAILWCVKNSAPSLKNMININHDFSSASNSQINNNNTSNIVNSIFLFSYINNKIPSWIKLLFKLIFFSMIVLKLLGFNFLDVLNNVYYLKIFSYVSCSLAITYQLLNLYLIYKFYKKNTPPAIPEFLPNFIINWLKEFEILGSTNESFNEFKNMCYREILVYLLLITLITLF